ncbi:MAG: helix-turn-helix transcriptional regulator [Eggerthellaceae bacterium]|nr:helix-turn-helix transcriptional regulator [Eggerthellaceae bacterium]
MEHGSFIVDRIREAREVRGISIAELARRAEIDESHLGKALRGKRELKADELIRLSYALELKSRDAFIPCELMGELQTLNRRGPGGQAKR